MLRSHTAGFYLLHTFVFGQIALYFIILINLIGLRQHSNSKCNIIFSADIFIIYY